MISPEPSGFSRTIAAAVSWHVGGNRPPAAAQRAGFLQIAAPAGDVAALLPSLPQGRAVYLAGRDRKPELEAALGEKVKTLVVYEGRARDGWSAAEVNSVGA